MTAGARQTPRYRLKRPASIDRRLGSTELIYCLLDQLYCLNFVAVAEIDGSLDAGRLTRALRAVQQEQPLLRARVALVGGRHWFKPVPIEKCPLTVEVRPLHSWRSTCTAQLAAPFSGDAPLARFLWFPGRGRRSVAAMVFYHPIADGRSSHPLLIEVLRRAAGESMPLGFRRARPSAQDLDLIERTGFVGRSIRTAGYWLHQGRNALRHVQQLPGYEMGVQPTRDVKVIPLPFTAGTSGALLAACHAHATTVQGALGAAQVLALNREFDAAESRTMALTSLADLRGALSGSLTEHELGLYIATVTTVHDLEAKPDFWRLACEIRDQLKAVLESGDANLIHTVYPDEPLLAPNEARARIVQALVALAPSSSMLTNVGRIEPVVLKNGARVRSMEFLLSPPAQYPICVTAASYDGCLHLSMLYDRLKIGERQALRIAKSMTRLVAAAAKSRVSDSPRPTQSARQA
jgi:hypothetical protein